MTILICKASASKLAIDGTGPLKEGPKILPCCLQTICQQGSNSKISAR